MGWAVQILELGAPHPELLSPGALDVLSVTTSKRRPQIRVVRGTQVLRGTREGGDEETTPGDGGSLKGLTPRGLEHLGHEGGTAWPEEDCALSQNCNSAAG